MHSTLPESVARQFSAELRERLTTLRREIHREPELSFQEHRTAKRLEQALSDLPFLAGLLLLIAFALADTPYRLRDSIIIGVAIAMLTLTRSVAIGLFGLIPLIWLLRQYDIRRFAASVVVIAIVFAACITPWMLRNQDIFGTLILGTNLGSNAYVGNHFGAPGGAVANIPPRLSERAHQDRA